MRKKLLSLLMILLTLTACQSGTGSPMQGAEQTAEEAARQVRTEYLAATGCSGSVTVTADYGLRVYEYGMDFSWAREGETVLTLTAPEELAGLTARVAQGGTRLEFDGISLDTGALTGEGLTPMELLPTLMEQTGGGYIDQCAFETLGEAPALRVQFRDPEVEAGTGSECIQWFARESHALLQAELYWNGELVLTGTFTNFNLGDDTGNGDKQSPDLGGDQSGEPGA